MYILIYTDYTSLLFAVNNNCHVNNNVVIDTQTTPSSCPVKNIETNKDIDIGFGSIICSGDNLNITPSIDCKGNDLLVIVD